MNTPRPTPETDAVMHDKNRDGNDPPDLCRTLECECDELKRWKAEALEVWKGWDAVEDVIRQHPDKIMGRLYSSETLRFIKERDDARAKLARLHRLVEVSDKINDERTDVQVALSAGWNEAVAYTEMDRLEAESLEKDAQIVALREALESNRKAWRSLVNSGDAGNWNPEEDTHTHTLCSGRKSARHQMKILAILQNTWAKDPDRVHALFARNQDRRHEIVARLLFASGCLTGRRLLTVFGEMLKQHDWTFEEASTIITGNSGGCPPYNAGHVRGVINRHRPDAIIAFGCSSREAIKDIRAGKKDNAFSLPPVIECVHPALQKPGWLAQLVAARLKLEKVLQPQKQLS